MAQVKCWFCNTKDDKVLMTRADTGKHYHTYKCYNEYIEEQARKEKENKEWNELFEYLKVIHDVPTIPQRNIARLKALRKGEDVQGDKTVKRYSRGVEFSLLLEAYKLIEEKVQWFVKDVIKDGKDAGDINKCITMVLNSGLNGAWQQRKIKQKREEELSKLESQKIEKDMSIDTDIVYKKKKRNNDISNLL